MKSTIKSLVKRAASEFGYEIRRAAPQKPKFHPFQRQFQFKDAAFSFWIANEDAADWYQQAGWESAGELQQLRRLVRPGDRILEIGCHHGFTTLLMANFAGEKGFVLGVEAFPQNALTAQAQVAVNGLGSRIRILNAAGAERAGEKVSLCDHHNSSVLQSNTGNGNTVETVTGDDLDQQFGPFDLLKVDVEGFEEKVLRGCRRLLARRPRLALELHLDELGKYGSTREAVLELIGAANYSGFVVLRPDYVTAHPLNWGTLPEHGIANLFLDPV